MPRRTTKETDRIAILSAWDNRPEGKLFEYVSKETGWTRSTVYSVLRKAGRLATVVTNPESGDSDAITQNGIESPIISRKESDDSLTIEFRHDSPVVTVADVVEKTGADMTVWRVKDFQANAWGSTMRVRAGQGENGRNRPDQPHVKQLWKISVRFERISPAIIDASERVESVLSRIAELAPIYHPVAYPKSTDRNLCLIAMEDVHFGKLCWPRETGGRPYDLEIADNYYRHTVNRLLSKAVAHPIERFVVTIGSDLQHVDNMSSQTTAGTPQDCDGRATKIGEVAEQAKIWAVERMLEVAPVHLIYKSGNHDRLSSWWLARSVANRFHNHPGVTSDLEPDPLKFFEYGATLLAFNHGDTIKAARFGSLIPELRPLEFARTRFHEVIVGHLHKTEQRVDVDNGIIFRRCRSLAETDFWHASKAYVGNDQGAEAYLYHYDDGMCVNLVARPPRHTAA